MKDHMKKGHVELSPKAGKVFGLVASGLMIAFAGLMMISMVSAMLGVVNVIFWVLLGLLGFSAVEFFFGGSTGPLLATTHGTPGFWVALALSLGLAIYSWRKHRETISRFEFAIMLVGVYLSVMVATTIMLANSFDVKSLKVSSEPLFSVDYHEPYTRMTSDGRAQVSARYQARYGDDGFWRDEMTQEDYEHLARQCETPSVLPLEPHDDQISKGDGRVWRADCRGLGWAVPQAWNAKDYIQGSRYTILRTQGLLSEAHDVADRLGLNDIPYPYTDDGPLGLARFYRVSDLTGRLSQADKDQAQAIFDRLSLSTSQNNAPVNAMFLVFDAADLDPGQVEDALTVAWRAPKVVDVIALINLDSQSQTVRWASIAAPTDDLAVMAPIERRLAAFAPFSAGKAAEMMSRMLANDGGRPTFAFQDSDDFAYVTAGFSLDWADLLILIPLVLTLNWISARFFAWFNPVLAFRKRKRKLQEALKGSG